MSDPMDIFNSAMDALERKDFSASLDYFIELHNLELDESDMFHVLRRTYGLAGWVELGRVYQPASRKLLEILLFKQSILDTGSRDSRIERDVAAIRKKIAS